MPPENIQLVARYPRRQASMGEYPRCVRGGFNYLDARGRFYICASLGFLSLTAGQPGTAVTCLPASTNSERFGRPPLSLHEMLTFFFSLSRRVTRLLVISGHSRKL